MLVVLFFFTGMIGGFFFRNCKNILKLSDKISEYAVYILIFLLGLSVGTNDDIINNITSLGLYGLIIALGGLAGSLFTAKLVGKIFFKENYEK
ncbi:MAG: DUF340 domain-containing protein [Candidatus Cloacimonadota bacterium]|nr:MAG: DUF340 domain-containing protein [Candidatus Cloacimonadota bacterium]